MVDKIDLRIEVWSDDFQGCARIRALTQLVSCFNPYIKSRSTKEGSRGSLKNVKVEKRVWDLEVVQEMEDLPYSTS